MNTRIIDNVFVCYCRITSDSVIEEYDPYATTGVVKKLFKNMVSVDRIKNNTVSNNTMLDAIMFKVDLMNVLLSNEVFPLKSIPESSDYAVETFLYDAINDFRYKDRVSFEIRLQTVMDVDGYITPRIKLLYNRNNVIEETFIPLLEGYE